ncbi:MAG: hypothetical protein PHV34_23275 [Verrucomicrobiae bacterium]|nr:hypothetical protein [Verrucomicrobiae bacterium]
MGVKPGHLWSNLLNIDEQDEQDIFNPSFSDFGVFQLFFDILQVQTLEKAVFWRVWRPAPWILFPSCVMGMTLQFIFAATSGAGAPPSFEQRWN